MIVPLHVENVQVWIAILIEVTERSVATPAFVLQIHRCRHVLEFSAAHVFVQNALLHAFGVQVTRKSVRQSKVKAAAALALRSVTAHIRNKQIQ